MKGTLVAFGCSNAYGHGLKDCIILPYSPGPKPSSLAWPRILAEKLGLRCKNLSQPGASNKSIWHTIVNASYQSTDTVVVGWTLASRSCIIKADFNIDDSVQDIGQWIREKPSKYFYLHLYNSYDMNVDLNLRMHHAKLYLDSLGVKNYHTLYANSEFSRLNWNHTPVLKTTLLPIHQESSLALDNTHPGEEAHKKYAQRVYEEIMENQ